MSDEPRYTLNVPPQAKWSLTLGRGTSLRFDLPNGPCWLHRWMQRLCFGFVWRRL